MNCTPEVCRLQPETDLGWLARKAESELPHPNQVVFFREMKAVAGCAHTEKGMPTCG